MFNLLNDLELYVTLSATGESKTLREAARKLGVSQATVSLRLKRLQGKHDSPLFDYQGRRIVFTAYGTKIIEMVTRLLSKFPSELQRLHLECDLPTTQPLRVGARIEVYDKIVNHLKLRTPLDLRLMNSLEIQQSLLDLKIDVGISHTRPDNTQFLSVPLYEDEFMLCCHKSLLKTFNGKLPVTTKQAMSKFISAVPALSYGHESRLLVDWLSKHRIDKNLLKTSVICENWNTLTQCLLNSVGFGIFPKSFIIKLPNEIIRETIPHRILAPLKFHMIFRRAYRYNPAILELKTALMGAK